MKLADYLKEAGISATSLAERIGVPPSTITRILRGERLPGLAIMRRICDATGGKVSALDDFEPRRRFQAAS